jgi:hypothetical protein
MRIKSSVGVGHTPVSIAASSLERPAATDAENKASSQSKKIGELQSITDPSTVY